MSIDDNISQNVIKRFLGPDIICITLCLNCKVQTIFHIDSWPEDKKHLPLLV